MTTPTKEQQDVIDHKDGPALVLAGPGTGKTHVVVERVKTLVEQGVEEGEILCVTFTEKATEEMQNRLADMGNMDTKVSTFHSFCKEVCEDCAEAWIPNQVQGFQNSKYGKFFSLQI